MWLIPIWFAILAVAVIIVGTLASANGRLPLWLGITEIGGLLLAAAIAFGVLATVRQPAFRADQYGIWLGVHSNRKRPKRRQVHLDWPEVAQLRIVPRRYGVLLEITLGPAAQIGYWPTAGQQALLLLGALALPFMFGRGTPAITTPGANPPRYLIKICDMTVPELKMALAAVKPGSMPVRVLTKKGALDVSVPPPRRPFSRRPASRVG